jgi:lipopolysaccharide biosynthesis glycosyltransferase
MTTDKIDQHVQINESPQVINLACASDDNFSQHLTVMLCSCLYNFSKENFLHVFVLDGGISLRKRQIIQNIFFKQTNSKITFITINSEKYRGLKKYSFTPEATYYKIDLPNLLPNLNKIIYLDCDIVILGDLSEIWNTDIKDKIIIAAQDPDIWMEKTYDNFFRLSKKTNYFNSGVMLMDLNMMRAENISQQTIAFIKENNDKLFHWDQQALNFILLNRWERISSQWNLGSGLELANNYFDTTLSKEDFYLAKKQPKLIHYSSRFFKPWLFESSGKYKKYYYEYLDKTDYSGWRPVLSIWSLYKKIVYYIYFYILSKKIRDFIYNNYKFLRTRKT